MKKREIVDPKDVEMFQLSPRDQAFIKPHHKNDHELFNKRLAKNYKLFQHETMKFKKSPLNKTSNYNLELLKQEQKDSVVFKMNKVQNSLRKWENFREKRTILIDRYINLKTN